MFTNAISRVGFCKTRFRSQFVYFSKRSNCRSVDGIAVDVLTCGQTFWGTPSTLVGTFFQSAMLLIRTASRNQHYRADIVIEPQIAHIRPDEIAKRDEMIELGEKAALEKLDDIKYLLELQQAAS